MNITFPDKTVIVTGAAHGFGRAIALAFAQTRRAGVGLRCDRRRTGRDTEALLGCRRLVPGPCRGRERPGCGLAFVAEAERASANGHIDILVNNAGGVLGQVGRPLEDVTPKQDGTPSSTST